LPGVLTQPFYLLSKPDSPWSGLRIEGDNYAFPAKKRAKLQKKMQSTKKIAIFFAYFVKKQ